MMASFIATLLRVESVTRQKSRYEGTTQIVEDVTFGSNPEYARVPIEAKSLKDAEKQAQEVLDGDLHGLGWTSYADPELWGKDLRAVVDVVAADDARQRDGEGNTRGSEDQASRESRLRKAAKG